MSLVDELKELIERTGVYNDRDLLVRILYVLEKLNSFISALYPDNSQDRP